MWRSQPAGLASGKGHEYMLKYLRWVPRTAFRAKTRASRAACNRKKSNGGITYSNGKLDLVVTLDFRLSSCLYSDIVLPTATWYEKDDMNTSDMHPFIHRCRPPLIQPGNRRATDL
ncbi:molybdopterin-dependent oxidoreductase [Klebsiella pneumoniae]|nr:molybdopterin-dependent oxidoreductase [Klebsiella pneumoniae]